MNTEEILAERGNTHGEFEDNAYLTQEMKLLRREWLEENNRGLSAIQCEALDMIFHKIARICCGNPDFKDHWDDIAGYATLVANLLDDE